MYKNLTFLIIIIDQITKRIATNYFYSERLILIIGLKTITNKGICFGLLNNLNSQIIIKITTALIILYSIYSLKTAPDKKEKIAWKLILAGGISNLIDRLIFGHVIDFIYIKSPFTSHETNVFNIADASITIGISILAYILIIKTLINKNLEK